MKVFCVGGPYHHAYFDLDRKPPGSLYRINKHVYRLRESILSHRRYNGERESIEDDGTRFELIPALEYVP